MQPDFVPLFRNPHLATLAGNFWKRPFADLSQPSLRREYRIDAGTTVIAWENQPPNLPCGQILCLHGLEGSADAGYIRSLASAALAKNFAVHRLNFRTCGGTEELCRTMYHSGLTSDTKVVVDRIAQRTGDPVFLVGYSLGGNVALKLTGELGAFSGLAGTVSVSAPIDLAACVKAIDKRSNTLYARRFLNRLRSRIRRKSALSPEVYSSQYLSSIRSIWQFDDRFTAPLFGFGNAANYYATQSALNFIPQIRTPTLLITAKDDPLVPFQIYRHSSIDANPFVKLIAPDHGGHVGFLSKVEPRFWVDQFVTDWIQARVAEPASV